MNVQPENQTTSTNDDEELKWFGFILCVLFAAGAVALIVLGFNTENKLDATAAFVGAAVVAYLAGLTAKDFTKLF